MKELESNNNEVIRPYKTGSNINDVVTIQLHLTRGTRFQLHVLARKKELYVPEQSSSPEMTCSLAHSGTDHKIHL